MPGRRAAEIVPGRTATPVKALVAAVAVALGSGCAPFTSTGASARASMAGHDMGTLAAGASIGPEHGLVLTTTTSSFLLVMDILPPEHMYMAAELTSEMPDGGELVVRGTSTPTTDPYARHIEVHVYDLHTGLVVKGARPRLTFADHAAGVATELDATEMRDVALSDIDIHYGSNAPIRPGHRFTLSFDLAGEHAEFSGTMS
jgi:hypothetical protein